MTDALPTILGVLLVAVVAGFSLLPLFREAPAQVVTATIADAAETERFRLYRQVLELEFDQQTGKLSREDLEALTRALLGRAGEILRTERIEDVALARARQASDVDAEVEREIAAARKAFAPARREQEPQAEIAS